MHWALKMASKVVAIGFAVDGDVTLVLCFLISVVLQSVFHNFRIFEQSFFFFYIVNDNLPFSSCSCSWQGSNQQKLTYSIFLGASEECQWFNRSLISCTLQSVWLDLFRKCAIFVYHIGKFNFSKMFVRKNTHNINIATFHFRLQTHIFGAALQVFEAAWTLCLYQVKTATCIRDGNS